MDVISSIVVCYVKQLSTLCIDLLFLFSVWQVMRDGNIVHLSCLVEHHIITIHLACNVYTCINQKKKQESEEVCQRSESIKTTLIIYLYLHDPTIGSPVGSISKPSWKLNSLWPAFLSQTHTLTCNYVSIRRMLFLLSVSSLERSGFCLITRFIILERFDRKI